MCENRVIERISYAKINADYKEFSANPLARVPIIRLFYGPHEHNGFIKHKPQKLYGLVGCLQKLHFTVEIIPSSHLNVLKVVILGYDVYRCNIKYLHFNIDCNFDEICRTVLATLEESVQRIYKNENVSKSITQWVDDQMQQLSEDSLLETTSSYDANESDAVILNI